MTDLRVDYQLLDQIDASLGRLAAEFGSIEAVQDSYNAAMGSPDIAGAMTGFAENWSIHRKKLVSSMQALQKMTQGTRQGFQGTDDDLSRQLAAKTR